MLEIEENGTTDASEIPQTQALPEDDEIAATMLMITDPSRYLVSNRSSVLTHTLQEVSSKLEALESQMPTENSSLENLEEDVEVYTKTLASTPDIWPTRGIITSYYGYRRSPFSSGSDFHRGVDIGVNYNTPIVAPAAGKVVERTYVYGYGYYLTIDHGMGFKTRYAHLNSFKVSLGEVVEKGQLIALSGNTGASTGPHLHYEVILNGVTQNPLTYLP